MIPRYYGDEPGDEIMVLGYFSVRFGPPYDDMVNPSCTKATSSPLRDDK
jgi:hypothetical protein